MIATNKNIEIKYIASFIISTDENIVETFFPSFIQTEISLVAERLKP